MTPPPPTPTLGRRLAFAALVAVLAAVAIETLSLLAAWALDGQRFSPARSAAERQRLRRQAGLAPGPAAEEPPAPEEGISNQVLHPFVGFVLDPETGVRRIDRLGFASLPGPAWSEDGDEVRVAVFGGSVAHGLASKGRKILIEELAAVPRFAGRPVVVRNFALGGYKQPQQLMILTYMLSLGERFDVVINLDGFNEVALAYRHNSRTAAFPFYPTDWPERVGAQDLDSRRRIGEIAYLRERRGRRSALCDAPLLRLSPTCDLVWRRLDAALGRRISELQAELDARQQGRRAFRTHGPESLHDGEAELFAELAAHWRSCSLLMHQLCRQNGSHYFHFLQPNQYVEGSKPMAEAERRLALADDDGYGYAKAVRLGYPLLAAEGERLVAAGVAFHDLRRVFADHPEAIYRDQCCHYNRHGNRLLARHIARIIVGHPALAGGGGAF